MPLQVQVRLAHVFHGPNPFAPEAVVVLQARFEGSISPRSLSRLRDGLQAWLPGLPSAPDDERFPASLGLALLRHAAALVSAHGSQRLESGEQLLWLGFHEPQPAIEALNLALRLVCDAHEGEADTPWSLSPTLSEALARFLALCLPHHPDICSRLLVLGAQARACPVRKEHAAQQAWLYGQGARARSFYEATPTTESLLGYQLAGNKFATHHFLAGLGLPVPEQSLLRTEEEARAAAARLGWPVVLKPVDSGQGNGVSTNIQDLDTLHAAFQHAQANSRSRQVILERHLPGDDHRLLVVRGKLHSVVRRDPPSVTGDGCRSLQALLGELNAARRAGTCGERFLVPVSDDEGLRTHLASQGLRLDDIPEAGRRITLRGNANISSGGVTTACTRIAHPDVRELAELIALNTGLDVVGIDYITTDITRSWRDGGGAVIEINTTPGIYIHSCDGQSEAEIGSLILGDTPARLPLTLLLGETADLQRVEARLPLLAPGLAYSGPGGVFLSGRPLALRHENAITRLRCLENNRAVQGFLLAWTPAELQRYGLPAATLDRFLVAGDVSLPKPWLDTLLRHVATGRVEVLETSTPAASTDFGPPRRE